MGSGQATGRKFGRKRDRSPSQKRYNAQRRDLANKKRKIAKHERAVNAAAERKARRKSKKT